MNIYSVIVCYDPDVANLLGICQSLVAGKSKVILVDNTEGSRLDERALPLGCELIALGTNTGIAHAQNVGVGYAIERGADVIVFVDQDSRIGPDFLVALISPLKIGEARIVSSLHFDDVNGTELPSVQVSKRGLSTTIYRRTSGAPYAVDVVISSGTAATKEVFEVAGLLDESFFIDFVDTEWCLRCRSKEIPIQVVPSAVMKHRIGSASIDLGVTTLLVHNPARCYYQIRNCFLLFRKTHIPFLFALKEMVSVFSSRVLLLFFVGDRFAYVKTYLSAIRDGLEGVVGERPV